MDIDPTEAGRAVKEYLATLDSAACGEATEVIPKFVSPSDPAAQWTGAMKSAAFFAYADNYLIDVKYGIIMDVEARVLSAKPRSAHRGQCSSGRSANRPRRAKPATGSSIVVRLSCASRDPSNGPRRIKNRAASSSRWLIPMAATARSP
jgi:hypothetical protein